MRKASWSAFNQAVCGLRFLYHVTLPRPWVVQQIPFGKRPKRLPAVLGAEEVSRLLACVPVLKHRTVLLTMYAAGLRLSEATHLQLDRHRQPAYVDEHPHGKGNKQGWCRSRPGCCRSSGSTGSTTARPTFFPGKTPDVPLSSATVQKACKLAGGLGPDRQARDAAHVAECALILLHLSENGLFQG